MTAKATIHIAIASLDQAWLDKAIDMWIETIAEDDLYGALEAAEPVKWVESIGLPAMRLRRMPGARRTT